MAGNEYFADEIGTLKLNQVPKQVISAGDVGYLISGIKEAKEVKVGDTLTDAKPYYYNYRF
jgi:GTP-binding protein LepA